MAFFTRTLQRFVKPLTTQPASPFGFGLRRFANTTPNHGKPADKNEMLETDHFASGQEKREIQEGEDYDVTDYEEFTKQTWGTADVPVKVPSKYGKRIVGCIGGPKPEDEHELLWHEVIPEKKTVCWECGQYFQLVAKKEPHVEGDHGHGHH